MSSKSKNGELVVDNAETSVEAQIKLDKNDFVDYMTAREESAAEEKLEELATRLAEAEADVEKTLRDLASEVNKQVYNSRKKDLERVSTSFREIFPLEAGRRYAFAVHFGSYPHQIHTTFTPWTKVKSARPSWSSRATTQIRATTRKIRYYLVFAAVRSPEILEEEDDEHCDVSKMLTTGERVVRVIESSEVLHLDWDDKLKGLRDKACSAKRAALHIQGQIEALQDFLSDIPKFKRKLRGQLVEKVLAGHSKGAVFLDAMKDITALPVLSIGSAKS